MSEHTPGPWHWRLAENGQGSDETSLVGSPDEWVKCDYFCFGWPPEGSEASRGPLHTPGHEHNHAPTVLSGIGWHGSGDLSIDTDSPDARLIASAPELLSALEAVLEDAILSGTTDEGQLLGSDELYNQVQTAIAKARGEEVAQ